MGLRPDGQSRAVLLQRCMHAVEMEVGWRGANT